MFSSPRGPEDEDRPGQTIGETHERTSWNVDEVLSWKAVGFRGEKLKRAGDKMFGWEIWVIADELGV